MIFFVKISHIENKIVILTGEIMKKQLLFIALGLTFAITVNSAELLTWPKFGKNEDANSRAVKSFIEFYNKDLKNISVSLTVSNGTQDTITIGPKTLEPGRTETIKPVDIKIEPLRSGAIFKIKTPSGTNLGVFAIHIESRGWLMSRYPDVYTDPKKVYEKVRATLLLAGAKREAYDVKEFDIYQVQKANVDINLSLRGVELGESSFAMNVDKE